MHSLEQWRFINLDVHRARCFQGNFSYQSSSLILSEFLVGLKFLISVYITDPEKSLKLIQCYHCSKLLYIRVNKRFLIFNNYIRSIITNLQNTIRRSVSIYNGFNYSYIINVLEYNSILLSNMSRSLITICFATIYIYLFSVL